MKRESIRYLLLISMVIFAVMITGCTQTNQTVKPVETEAPKNLPTSAHAETTPVAISTETPEETQVPEVSSTEQPKMQEITKPLEQAGLISFSGDGISLKYPDRFAPINADSLEQMKTAAQQSGIDVITILTATDSKDSIQVTKQNAEATIEGMYNEKMAVAREIAINGTATVMGMKFIKYGAEKETLADGSAAVKVSAENVDKGSAVTYLICKPGVVYNINFVYDSPDRAESQSDARAAFMQTVQVS